MSGNVHNNNDASEFLKETCKKYLQIEPFKRSFPKRSFFSSSEIDRKQIINTINYLNFLDEQLFIYLTDPQTHEGLFFRAFPGPCTGKEINCSFTDETIINFDDYSFQGFLIDNGKSIILVEADLIHVSVRSIQVRLKKSGTVFHTRHAQRFACHRIDAVLQQGGVTIEGSLEEFNPSGLRIALKENSYDKPSLLSLKKNISIELLSGDKKVFSGLASLIREDSKKNILVVKPHNLPQTLYRQRESRNPRTVFSPSLKVVFDHPLILKKTSFDVVDITTSGFSVNTDSDTSFLMPGMIIDDVTITRPGLFKLNLSAQVVYERQLKKKKIKYGFAIRDMDVVTHNQLYDMYCNAIDKHANFTRHVNMGLLWEFFFESGFIYPQKYSSFSRYKEEYKKTYEKLYHHSPEVFANFTYQANEKIYGHVSIIKAYERTWMIHHLAAKPMDTKRTGLHVLNHVLNYFDGFYRMPSIGMDYMIFYFRPDNHFPNYFFGGFCRDYNDPQGCSMDCFAYLTAAPVSGEKVLPKGWKIMECSSDDISDMKSGYKKLSDGLMVDAFCLDEKKGPESSLEECYKKYGLKRRHTAYALKHNGKAKAYIIADESNMGINLSDLLNCIKIIIVDSADLPWDILRTSLGSLHKLYSAQDTPVLIFPYQYADNQKISYNKKYNLWVLSAKASDSYSEHLKKQAKIRPIKLIFKMLLTRFLNR